MTHQITKEELLQVELYPELSNPVNMRVAMGVQLWDNKPAQTLADFIYASFDEGFLGDATLENYESIAIDHFLASLSKLGFSIVKTPVPPAPNIDLDEVLSRTEKNLGELLSRIEKSSDLISEVERIQAFSELKDLTKDEIKKLTEDLNRVSEQSGVLFNTPAKKKEKGG